MSREHSILLYTIGHSNHPVDELTGLLAAHGIIQVVDVRSSPFSRFNPQFNRKSLEQYLAAQGMQYIYMGDTLGGRPKDPLCYKHHAVPASAKDIEAEIDYAAVMQRPWFIEGIQALLDLARQQPTCILCSEKDPAACHRHQLITRYLIKSHPGVTTWHILADGSLVNGGEIARTSDASNTGQLSLEL
jgi:uncharacterized protein (DUF488 family)